MGFLRPHKNNFQVTSPTVILVFDGDCARGGGALHNLQYYFVNSLINFAVLDYLLFLVLVRLDHVSIDIVSNYKKKNKKK